MIGIEFVSDRATKAPAKALATNIVRRAYHNGLLLLECGASGIRLIPPLMIDAALVDEGIDRLERAMQEAQAEAR
jgi:4-aminobutyrate aminotransferase